MHAPTLAAAFSDGYKVAVVRIVGRAGSRPRVGSGVRVAPGLVLTCAHCLHDGADVGQHVDVKVFVPGSIWSDWRDCVAEILWVSDTHFDLAVLSVDKSDFPIDYIMPLASGPCQIRQKCDLYGYPTLAGGVLERFDATVDDPTGQCANATLPGGGYLNVGVMSSSAARQRLDGMSGGPVVVERRASYLLNLQLLASRPGESVEPMYNRVYGVPVALFASCPVPDVASLLSELDAGASGMDSDEALADGLERAWTTPLARSTIFAGAVIGSLMPVLEAAFFSGRELSWWDGIAPLSSFVFVALWFVAARSNRNARCATR